MHKGPEESCMLCVVQGHHILTFMQAIPQDSEPAPIIWSYADLNLQTLASAGLLKTRGPPPQAPSPVGGSGRAAQSAPAPVPSPGAAGQSAAAHSPAQQACRSAARNFACKLHMLVVAHSRACPVHAQPDGVAGGSGQVASAAAEESLLSPPPNAAASSSPLQPLDAPRAPPSAAAAADGASAMHSAGLQNTPANVPAAAPVQGSAAVCSSTRPHPSHILLQGGTACTGRALRGG
jgi:hypothetical protein